ncbi:dioxygenase [Caenimonas sedimenti]|uniref:Dioxygenase n=1 Tax=Caenimonas sedimenti TaxID=2596921 RepID=A0A562ZGI5_9BURK|nr:class III extradiol ring-cleavage dioxygenase [Caenimonas sedimenti]TWO67019.1 dioxygenase [Caenimonas sedimenti]
MSTLPSMFISHGAPTFAIEPGLAGSQLGALGRTLAKPRGIVIVSPHWMTAGVEVTSSPAPETIHDFGGFPRALYQIQYPAPGAPELAARTVEVLGFKDIPATLNGRRGLDHGAWVPLMHLFPEADVPVVQVSLPLSSNAQSAFALGQALAPLADEGVLVIGSGSLTHNLYEFRTGEVAEAAYAREFSRWVRQAVLQADFGRLLRTLELAPHAARAHPTHEHFLPLLLAAGAARSATPVTVLDGGIRHGVLAMESYLFGRSVNLPVPQEEALAG